ncbi:Uncharacterised protein [Streptococcus pneumoniae]|nr:Uncharacterised protein [Streptococcus pneumoniae]
MVYPIANRVPTKAITPAPIAVSSSFAFTIGETAAMAAAPHIPVPIPKRRDKPLSAFIHLARKTVKTIANKAVPTSRSNNPNP